MTTLVILNKIEKKTFKFTKQSKVVKLVSKNKRPTRCPQQAGKRVEVHGGSIEIVGQAEDPFE
jgi:hypothetical protein